MRRKIQEERVVPPSSPGTRRTRQQNPQTSHVNTSIARYPAPTTSHRKTETRHGALIRTAARFRMTCASRRQSAGRDGVFPSPLLRPTVRPDHWFPGGGTLSFAILPAVNTVETNCSDLRPGDLHSLMQNRKTCVAQRRRAPLLWPDARATLSVSGKI